MERNPSKESSLEIVDQHGEALDQKVQGIFSLNDLFSTF